MTLAVFLFLLAKPSGVHAQVANSDETLRDSCHSYFKSVREAELNVRTIESQSVRMVRLGGSPDIALYERLYRVHQSKVANAKTQLRQYESALSGCLANALREKSRALAEETSSKPKSLKQITTNPTPSRNEGRSPASSPYIPSHTPSTGGGQTVR